jgi:hypothetical protein
MLTIIQHNLTTELILNSRNKGLICPTNNLHILKYDKSVKKYYCFNCEKYYLSKDVKRKK